MRNFLSLHPKHQGAFTPDELDVLDALVQQAVDILGITEQSDRHEAAARIVALQDFCLQTREGRDLRR